MDQKQQTPYELLGGESVLRNLVKRFYEIMDTLPETKSLRDMHPQDLQGSEDKLFMFMSGWLGGPNLFQEKFGHPMLRARHMPFKIGKPERDQWMICMVHACDDLKIEDPLRSELLHSLLRLADHMRNQKES
ncbi:group II truncated hemoglobin [Bdellovibrio sp. HCB-110]|uniref:group II truncated hemoglobin n=1 Tax=Bdellovibrio sp. HCB-110 TaxID=3391182 RepID=UPI0039B3E028